MSSPSIATPPAVFLQPADNQYVLTDHKNSTQVTLHLGSTGPLVQGQGASSPRLQYKGTEGNLTFTGDQIVTENTALGTTYTVVLNVVPDLRAVAFTLVIPQVVHAAIGTPQAFDTIAIVSDRHISLRGFPTTTGASTTYTVLHMHGTASKVENAA